MTREELIRLEELFGNIRRLSRDSRGLTNFPSNTRVLSISMQTEGSYYTLDEGEFDAESVINIFNDNIRQRAATLEKLINEFESIKVDFNEK